MMTRFWIVTAVLLLQAHAQADELSQLTELLETARIEMRMPGLRAAVRFDDGRVVRAATGLADKEAGIALTDTVGMPGGSTGKPFVAALTMLLIEDGVLSLDDSAAKWLGDRDWFERLPNARDIRIRHLLSHSSGIGDYPGTFRFTSTMVWRAIRHGSAAFTPEELIKFVLDKRPAFPVGQGFRYTDAGYLVLGLLIEEATGQDYYELLSDRLLEPLALHDVRPQDQSVLEGITPGYTGRARNLKKDGRMKFDPTSEWTGGGLITTPTMLVEFFAALADGRAVGKDAFLQMLGESRRLPDDLSVRYGFGLFVYDGGGAFGHGGMWPGYRTQVTHDFDTSVTIAVQTNRDGRVDMHEIVNRIAGLATSW